MHKPLKKQMKLLVPALTYNDVLSLQIMISLFVSFFLCTIKLTHTHTITCAESTLLNECTYMPESTAHPLVFDEKRGGHTHPLLQLFRGLSGATHKVKSVPNYAAYTHICHAAQIHCF